MFQLTVNDTSKKMVVFDLVQDGDDVNVTADGDLIGWFEINSDGKIEFVRAAPRDTYTFAVNDEGYLLVT